MAQKYKEGSYWKSLRLCANVWYGRPYILRKGPGRLVFHEKVTNERGDLYEALIWEVPVSVKYPDGIRYRLAFIRFGESEPEVLYDNHHPKGHHRHVGRIEETYGFVNVERLIQDFLNDVRRIEGGEQ